MLMPFGAFKGQPVANMRTTYLVWLISRDSIRFKRWPFVLEVLNVLRSRFADFDTLAAELQVNAPPPDYWKAKKPDRTAEKAEKLRILEEQRREAKHKRREERKRQYQELKAAVLAEEAERLKKLRDARRPPDFSDLI